MKIHPSAIVSPEAQIDETAEIGPFCIIESGVEIAAGCRLLAQVKVHSGTTIGRETTVFEGAVLGGMPQHTRVSENLGKLVIGERNMLREQVTIHSSMNSDQATVIGDDCMLMVGSHIAHDCRLGNRVILTNGVMVGGHVEIGDRAYLGGNAAVHQFCRIGSLAMVGGCSKLVQDVPPYLLTDGASAMIVGLNTIGLRRAGFSRDQIKQLKAAYRTIYRQGLPFDEMVATLEDQFTSHPATDLASFFRGGTRGFVQERRSPPRAAIRIHPEVDDEVDAPSRRLAS